MTEHIRGVEIPGFRKPVIVVPERVGMLVDDDPHGAYKDPVTAIIISTYEGCQLVPGTPREVARQLGIEVE